MEVEFLVATTDRTDAIFLSRMFSNINELNYSVLVINQCINVDVKTANEKVPQFYNTAEIGLSKSRNMALKYSKGDILVFSDDDVIYKANAVLDIRASFEEYDADIITFRIQTPDGKPYKNYREDIFKYTPFNILRISSIEIALRKNSFTDDEAHFDELFGLGSRFPTSEENIFIADCLKMKKRIMAIPKTIVIHPSFSSAMKINKNSLIATSAALYRIYPYSHVLTYILFSFKQYPRYKHEYSLIEYFIIMLKGKCEYKMLRLTS